MYPKNDVNYDKVAYFVAYLSCQAHVVQENPADPTVRRPCKGVYCKAWAGSDLKPIFFLSLWRPRRGRYVTNRWIPPNRMAVLSGQGRRNLRFFGGGEAAGDRWEEEEKKRIVDYLHEPDDDVVAAGEEMGAGKRKRWELSLPLPLSACSPNASSTGGSSYSPRSLLSRWLLPLQKASPSSGGGGCGGGGGGGVGDMDSGVGCLVRLPRYNCKKKKKKKKKREEEVVGPSVSEVVEGDGAGSRGSTKLSVSSGNWNFEFYKFLLLELLLIVLLCYAG